MGTTGTNPIPQGPKFVNPDGSLTQEAYYFLLTLLKVTQSSEIAAANPFVPQQIPAGNDPAVQVIERLQAFVPPSPTAIISSALQRIAALEVRSAFREPGWLSESITEFTPAILLGATATTASAALGISIQIGSLVVVVLNITLSAKGIGAGGVTVTGLPITAGEFAAGGAFGQSSGFVSLTGALVAEIAAGGTALTLYQEGATGTVALTNANVSNTTAFSLLIAYQAA